MYVLLLNSCGRLFNLIFHFNQFDWAQVFFMFYSSKYYANIFYLDYSLLIKTKLAVLSVRDSENLAGLIKLDTI